MTSRQEEMLKLYGEVCKRKDAAKILHCCPKHISNMVKDGRLKEACAGTKIDVRSIAEYIETPREHDNQAKAAKLQAKYNSEWSV
jgi:hypothetical protein